MTTEALPSPPATTNIIIIIIIIIIIKGFPKHERAKSHIRAVKMRMRHENVYASHLETIPDLTSNSVAEKRQNNRKTLLQILSNIRCLNKDCFLLLLDINFLLRDFSIWVTLVSLTTRQSLALHDNWNADSRNGENSNFHQLLIFQSEDDKYISFYTKRNS